ncbi:MAG: carbohydrate ABC transporter permease [Gaiellales bacterium]
MRRRRLLLGIAEHAVLIAVSLAFMLPVLFMFLTAVMTDRQALSSKLIPDPFVWSNFRTVFDSIDLPRYTWNTFLYAGLSTVGVVVSCIPVAYAFSRLEWRGRNIVFLLVLSTLMLPTQVTSIPLYILWAKQFHDWTGIQFIGTLKPLIIPGFFGDAFSIFLLRQFFMTIPKELTDAMRVDGGGELQILLRVVIPLAKPAIAAVALFNFIYAWNDFYGPLVYLAQNPDSQTLSIALSSFRTLHHVDWNLTMAAALIFMLPVVVIFFLAQRVFIEGITLTGVKG